MTGCTKELAQTMEFFEACADWSEHKACVCVMERDEFDGWYARVQLHDGGGPFSASVNAMPRNQRVKVKDSTKKRLENFEEYSDRVAKALTLAVVDARKRRIGAKMRIAA